jgi:AbiV family abortive infection protein
MKKSILDTYAGPLTLQQIADGMNAAAINAGRLGNDARILLEAGSHATASSIAVLSLEESGKISILRQLVTADGIMQKDIWRRYRSHNSKNFLALVPDLVIGGGTTLKSFKRCFSQDGLSERQTYDALKQSGVYTDCLADQHWSIPSQVITMEIASAVVSWANRVSRRGSATTVRELELWRLYMSGGESTEKLVMWASAMEEEGLKPKGYAEDVQKFTEGGC